jgi:hypothetical protein
MAEQITIESSTDEAIAVRRLTHGHHYCYAIRSNEGRRLLGAARSSKYRGVGASNCTAR